MSTGMGARKNRTILIFDWDDTLFAAAKFIKEIKRSLRRLGVAEEIFFLAYRLCRDKNGCWSPRRLVKELKELIPGLAEKMVLARLDFCLARAKKFVYPEAAAVLKKMAARGAKMILISFGPKKFQAAKIKNSGLAKFFDKIIFDCVDSAKVEKISKTYGAESRRGSVYFIEDKGSGVEAVKRANPGINAVWIKRPDGRYLSQPCQADFVIKNLRDLEKIIKCGEM